MRRCWSSASGTAFVLENPSRARAVLDLEALNAPLEALMALPLRNEDEFVGALWLGHDRAPSFRHG